MNESGRDPWLALVEAENAFFRARMRFLEQADDRVAVLREALRTAGQGGAALRLMLAGCVSEEEVRALFSDLVNVASVGHSNIEPARLVILSLSREWVIANIEAAAEPLLREGGEEEYRRLLELYTLLDGRLAARLAARARASDDPAIREAGVDFSE